MVIVFVSNQNTVQRFEIVQPYHLFTEIGFCMDAGTPPEMQPRGYGIFRRWPVSYTHLDVYKRQVLGLCYMGAAYMSQHYERTVETAVYHVLYGHWDTARNAAQRVWYI